MKRKESLSLFALIITLVSPSAFCKIDLSGYIQEKQGDDLLIKKKTDSQRLIILLTSYNNLPRTGIKQGSELTLIGEIAPSTLTSILSSESDNEEKNPRDCKLVLSNAWKKEFLAEDETLLHMPEKLATLAEEIANKLCSEGIKKLILHSTGGNVASAKVLGMAVKLAGISTEVPSGALCASACVEILIKGAKQTIDDAAVIMVHRPSDGDQGIPHILTSRKFLPPTLKEKVKKGVNIYLSGAVAKEIGLSKF